MLARHLLLVVNEPFRYDNEKEKMKIEWEPMLIFRRLLLVVLITFILPPVTKLYPSEIFLLLFNHLTF